MFPLPRIDSLLIVLMVSPETSVFCLVFNAAVIILFITGFSDVRDSSSSISTPPLLSLPYPNADMSPIEYNGTSTFMQSSVPTFTR